MKKPWGADNCGAVKAQYSVYSIPQAAALWCGIPQDQIEVILEDALKFSSTGIGRGIWILPEVPCLEHRCRAIALAIEEGSLPYVRDDGFTAPLHETVAVYRRHVLGRDLRYWMEKVFPNEKPPFLFEDAERSTHTDIGTIVDGNLKSDQGELEKGLDSTNKKSILGESGYWVSLACKASKAVEEYPAWRKTQRKVQKTANLMEWLTGSIGADNREAEMLKKVLSDLFNELQ